MENHDDAILREVKFHAFIDAGSSGTRLYIYYE
jgi:hypothetical protein